MHHPRPSILLTALLLAAAPALASAGELAPEPAHAAESSFPGQTAAALVAVDADQGGAGGCACDSSRTAWPSMLALPWLLFFLRLRVTQDPRGSADSRSNHGSSKDTPVDAAPGNTLIYDPSLLEPAQCSMLRTLRP